MFDDREKSEENRFKHDQELYFRFRNRRNKLFGLKIAERLGLEGEKALAYAKDVVMVDFEQPGDDDVIGKVSADLKAQGHAVDEVELRRELEKLAAVAKSEVMAE